MNLKKTKISSPLLLILCSLILFIFHPLSSAEDPFGGGGANPFGAPPSMPSEPQGDLFSAKQKEPAQPEQKVTSTEKPAASPQPASPPSEADTESMPSAPTEDVTSTAQDATPAIPETPTDTDTPSAPAMPAPDTAATTLDADPFAGAVLQQMSAMPSMPSAPPSMNTPSMPGMPAVGGTPGIPGTPGAAPSAKAKAGAAAKAGMASIKSDLAKIESDPESAVDQGPQKPETFRFIIKGDADIKLPFGLGKTEAKLTAKIVNVATGAASTGAASTGAASTEAATGTIFSFTLTLEKDVKFAGLDLRKPTVRLTTAGTFELIADCTINKNEVIAHLVSKEIKLPDGGKKRVTEFIGEFKDKKPLFPFKHSNNKELRELSIQNPEIGMKPMGAPAASTGSATNSSGSGDSDKKSGYMFFFQGKVDVFGVPMTAMIEKTPLGFVASATPTKGWKLSDCIKSAKGTVFDKIPMNDVTIVISSVTYLDANSGVQVNPGFNLVAKIPIKSLGILNKMLPQTGQEDLIIAGCLNKNISAMFLEAIIPIKLTLKKHQLILNNLAARLGGDPPSFFLLAKLNFYPHKNNTEILIFTMQIGANAEGQVTLAGTMQGDWVNPMGIHGFTLEDVAISIGVNPPDPLPTKIGFAGKIIVGSKGFEVATKINLVEPDQIVFIARMMDKNETLSLEDLMSIPRKIGLDIPHSMVPPIELKNVDIYLVPVATTIGMLSYPAGTKFKGDLLVGKDFDAFVDVEVGQMGLIFKGFCPKFNVGPLAVNGAGMDHKYGTTDDGAVIDIELTPKKQSFFVSGQIIILDGCSACDIEININKDGFYFDATVQILYALTISISAETIKKNGKVDDFIIDGKITIDLEDAISHALKDFAIHFIKEIKQKAVDVIKKEIKKKKNQVKAIKQKKNNLWNELHKRANKIKEQDEKKVQNAIDKVNREEKKLKSLKKKVDYYINKVDSIHHKAEDAQDKAHHYHHWYQKAQRGYWWAKYGIYIAAWRVARTTLKGIEAAGYNVAKASLEVAKEELKIARAAAGVIGTIGSIMRNLSGYEKLALYDIEIAGTIVEIEGLTASKEIAIAALNAVSFALDSLAGIAKKLIEIAEKGFKFDKATVHFSLEKLVKAGQLPKVSFYFAIFEHKEAMKNLSFNWKKLGKSVMSIGKKIFAKVKP